MTYQIVLRPGRQVDLVRIVEGLVLKNPLLLTKKKLVGLSSGAQMEQNQPSYKTKDYGTNPDI